jgi:hypothetical protein
MYCYHCGKKIDERKLEAKGSSLEANAEVLTSATKIEYVCPRCGYLIHEGHDEQDIKSLAAAAHAEIQRGNNSFAQGMGLTSVGVISMILAWIFFRLSFKPAQQNQLIRTCPEYFVFWILLVAAVILLGFGLTLVIIGAIKKHDYQILLKDVQNQTFSQ